jgi:peptidoglycan hydrolase CwlO-like protein
MNLLSEVSEAKQHYEQVTQQATTLKSEIELMEARISALQLELNNKKAIVETAQRESKEYAHKIEFLEAKKIGLCIR